MTPELSPLAADVLFFALYVLKYVATLLAGALLMAAVVDAGVSLLQIMRK